MIWDNNAPIWTILIFVIGCVFLVGGIATVIFGLFGGFDPLFPQNNTDTFNTPDDFEQGIMDGKNETYNMEAHRLYLREYREGYKTGLLIRYQNCTGT